MFDVHRTKVARRSARATFKTATFTPQQRYNRGACCAANFTTLPEALMADAKPLAGQTAWITGSSRGLGRVMATKLCALGAAVAVHGTRQNSPQSFGEGQSMEQVAADIATAAGGGTTMPIWGDVMDEAEVQRMADAIRSRLGKIDILVTNAGGDIGAGGTGVGRGGRPSPDDCIGIPLADIRAVMDRNLLSCILCCRAVAPEMQARKSGRII
ncbi:MAG: SDR family oxidoreductase, partial [Planctomycetia bacterium]|nr:SDR family oxidoreductase [Planctomycetia bacterium]